MAVAIEELYRQHDFLRGLALDLIDDEHRAEDLVQRTLLLALQRPPSSPGALRAWLRTVVRNLAIDSIQSERQRRQRERRAARAEAVSDRDLPAVSERRRSVLRAVAALDEPYRTSIELYYLQELGTRDISTRLGVPVSTVKTRLCRGRERLRCRLGGDARVRSSTRPAPAAGSA